MWPGLKYYSHRAFLIPILFIWALLPWTDQHKLKQHHTSAIVRDHPVTLFVLGNVQDGGSPHIGCNKKCCIGLFDRPDTNRMVVSFGLADHLQKKSWLIEASPDISGQIQWLSRQMSTLNGLPDGILLTHAHIGHYTGLMYLGKEAMNSRDLPVYVQPRMKQFLETNGPWSQLVRLNNIRLIQTDTVFDLTQSIRIKTIPVPHRDEYSETVAYWIEGPAKKALIIPDIDKWEKWDQDIRKLIHQVDYAFLDGTFYNEAEVNHRDIKEIPHPLIIESMSYFKDLKPIDKNKIYFVHLNHTNPLLDPASAESLDVEKQGFHVARKGMKFGL